MDYLPYFERIFRKMETIIESVKALERRQERMEARLEMMVVQGSGAAASVRSAPVAQYPAGFLFPLETSEQLEQLNTALEDGDVFDKMVCTIF